MGGGDGGGGGRGRAEGRGERAKTSTYVGKRPVAGCEWLEASGVTGEWGRVRCLPLATSRAKASSWSQPVVVLALLLPSISVVAVNVHVAVLAWMRGRRCSAADGI